MDKARDAIRDLVKPALDLDKVRTDMFYDICSSSGWTREEIDEMEVRPEELDLDEWTLDEFTKWVSKWLSKLTGYYVEYKESEVGDYFSFHNAIAKMLGNMVAINEKAKSTLEELENNTHVAPLDGIEKTIEWAADFICETVPEVPEMKVPDKKMLVM